MHRIVTAGLAALPLLAAAACHADSDRGDAVRAGYDNHAAAIDAQARSQPDPTAQKIYHARADALREEGRDREKGLEGGTPSSSPAISGKTQ